MTEGNRENPYYQMFEQTSALAAGFELRARLSTDLSPTSNGLAVDGTLEKILAHLRGAYPEALKAAAWERLGLARRVRNKLFHGELHAASALVGAPVGGVRKGEIPDGATGQDILKVIEGLAAGGGSPVAGTTTKDTGVIGWVFECATSGAFATMDALFIESKLAMSSVAKYIHAKS